MPNPTSAYVTGWEDLKGGLKALDRSLRSDALLNAALSAGQVLAKEMKARAPRDTGKARRYIIAVEDTEFVSGKYAASVDVAPSGEGWYIYLHEIGFRSRAPRPFMRPAVESVRDEMWKAARDVLFQAVERAALTGR